MRILPALLLPCFLHAAPPDMAVPPADAVRSATGLAHRVIQAGRGGASPQGDDMVIVHFTGWDRAGKTFTNTRNGDHPRCHALNRLMPGMREALGTMTPGASRRIWIPEALGYAGAEGKPKGDLVMDLEYLDLHPNPNRAPGDVAAPGPDALKQKGVFSRVLRPGIGKTHPRSRSWITVHYSGWTTDGKLFDSSLLKGSPEVLQLKDTIEGWIDGIPLMVEGERRRFWIPQRLAYRGDAGKPAGMLVFDVELVAFRD